MGRILFMLVTITSICATPIEEIKLGNSEIMFENLGSLLEYRNVIELYTKIKITSVNEVEEYLYILKERINTTCYNSKIRSVKSCLSLNKEIELWTSKIDKSTRSINHFFNRQKRGAINAIGSVSKFLFGTMDVEDSEKIYNTLEKLKENDGKMMELMDKQVAVIKTNFEFMRDTTGNLSASIMNLEEKLNIWEKNMEKNLAVIQNDVSSIWAEIELNRLALFALAELERIHGYILEQGEIINALQQHKIHPLILDSQLLVEILQNMTERKSHPYLYSPIVINQLAIIDLSHWGNEVGIRMTIAVLQKEEYNLYKIYPLPKNVESGHNIIINIEWDYIANNTAGQFVHYTAPELSSNCRIISNENNKAFQVCKEFHPKILSSENEYCVLNIFIQQEMFKSQESSYKELNCKYHVLKVIENHIIPLKALNNWLYIFHEPHELTGFCNPYTQKRYLQGKGIIKLKEKCNFILGNLELPFHEIKNNQLPNQISYTFNNISNMDVNFTHTLATVKFDTHKSKLIKTLGSEDIRKEFDKRSMSIANLQAEIKTENNRQRKLDIVKTTSTANSILIGIILSIFAIYMLVKIVKRCKKKTKKTRRTSRTRQIEVVNNPSLSDDHYLEPVNLTTQQTAQTNITNESFSHLPGPISSTPSISTRRPTESPPPLPNNRSLNRNLKPKKTTTIVPNNLRKVRSLNENAILNSESYTNPQVLSFRV